MQGADKVGQLQQRIFHGGGFLHKYVAGSAVNSLAHQGLVKGRFVNNPAARGADDNGRGLAAGKLRGAYEPPGRLGKWYAHADVVCLAQHAFKSFMQVHAALFCCGRFHIRVVDMNLHAEPVHGNLRHAWTYVAEAYKAKRLPGNLKACKSCGGYALCPSAYVLHIVAQLAGSGENKAKNQFGYWIYVAQRGVHNRYAPLLGCDQINGVHANAMLADNLQPRCSKNLLARDGRRAHNDRIRSGKVVFFRIIPRHYFRLGTQFAHGAFVYGFYDMNSHGVLPMKHGECILAPKSKRHASRVQWLQDNTNKFKNSYFTIYYNK